MAEQAQSGLSQSLSAFLRSLHQQQQEQLREMHRLQEEQIDQLARAMQAQKDHHDQLATEPLNLSSRSLPGSPLRGASEVCRNCGNLRRELTHLRQELEAEVRARLNAEEQPATDESEENQRLSRQLALSLDKEKSHYRDLQAMTARCQKAEKGVADLLKHQQGTQQVLARLVAEHKSLKEIYERQQEMVSAVSTETTQLTQQRNTWKTKAEELQRQLDELLDLQDREDAALQIAQDDKVKELNIAKERLEARLKKIEETNDKIRADRDRLKAELKDLKEMQLTQRVSAMSPAGSPKRPKSHNHSSSEAADFNVFTGEPIENGDETLIRKHRLDPSTRMAWMETPETDRSSVIGKYSDSLNDLSAESLHDTIASSIAHAQSVRLRPGLNHSGSYRMNGPSYIPDPSYAWPERRFDS